MNGYRELLSTAHEAVDLAGELMRSTAPGSLTAKGDRDMATEVDFLIERSVREFLRGRTPQIGFWGEEEGKSPGLDDLFWCLDPIDGTVNFIHGIPLCGISLGLIQGGRPRLGVIGLPFLSATYAAVEGHGAYCGSQRISASPATDLKQAVVSIGDYAVGADAAAKNRLRISITQRLAESAQRVRMNGSAVVDLAWVADGKLDASITMANYPWDMAAGVVIAREAGAVVMDRDGSDHTLESGATVVAAPGLAAQIIELVADAAGDD